MKSLQVLFINFIFISSLHAAVILTDSIDSSITGWSGTGLTYDGGEDAVEIPRDETATKTYNLGVAYINTPVTISFDYHVPIDWEDPDDDINVLINGSIVQTYHDDGNDNGGNGTISFIAVADGSGDIKLGFNPDSSTASEVLYIKEVEFSDYTLPAGFTCANPRVFTEAFTQNVNGQIDIIGNSVVCQNDGSGNCEDPGNTRNNSINMMFINIDGDTSTFNHSSAELNIPADSTIIWAGLYWQGLFAGPTNTNQANSKTVKLKIPGGAYVDIISEDAKHNWVYLDETNDRWMYQGASNITSLIDKTNPNGTYTVANLATATGTPAGGSYGAWSIVLAYKNTTMPFRNLTIYDGYQGVMPGGNGATCADRSGDPQKACNYAAANNCPIDTASTGVANPINVPLSGFLTPKTNSVESSFAIFTGEGDRGASGDSLSLTDKSNTVHIITDGQNPANDIQNATISKNALQVVTLEPQRTLAGGTPWINSLGADIDMFDISGLLSNDQTSTVITMQTNGDGYFPGVFAFSTDIYEPRLCYDYSLKQDNQFLNIDRSTPYPYVNSYISPSDIDVSVYLKNEEADILAQGISIKSDANTTFFDQTGNIYTSNINGSTLIDRGTPNNNPPCDYNATINNGISDIGCTDGHNIRKGLGDLDALDYIYSKFTLKPQVSGLTDVNESIGLTVDYFIQAGGTTVIYNDYKLGGTKVGLCSVATSYNPAWGQFNVIRDGQTLGNENNNLYTQISRKSFNTSIVFDSDPSDRGTHNAPTNNLDTTVLVDIVDMDAYGDINASCANPDANITSPIFVPLAFDSTTWQTNIPAQTSDYFNVAVKNAAYRIWYFADSNGSLITNWTAATTNAYKTVTNIAGLYDNSVHTACSSECSDDTSVSCFECIRANYAQPICSRDNFSIRPQSYDLHLHDVNQTNAISDTSNIDLSVLKNLDANSASTTNRIDLAAGYDYRYEITATGYDSTAKVPGYTRYFRGLSDYKATMYWDPQSGQNATVCNDTNNTDLIFYVGNGRMEDKRQSHLQVGEYKVNIIDTSWTSVDWDFTFDASDTHHTTANGFASTDDCVQTSFNSSSSMDINGQHGCTIKTDHDGGGFGNYQDHDITFHPYQFDVLNSMTLSTSGITAVSPSNAPGPFVYMENIDTDENMSVHLNTTIAAIGKNSTTPLSNYVTGCYSNPLTITIDKSDLNSTAAYKYNFKNLDTNDSVIGAVATASIAAGITSVDPIITTPNPDTFFQKNQNGVIKTRTNLNFHRDKNTTVNPVDINYTTYSVTDISTFFNADLVLNKSLEGNTTINQNVLHYYGRTAAKDATIICDATVSPCVSGTDDDDVYVYYEVFCNGTGCDKTLLPTDLSGNTLQKVDSRWFINLNHNSTDYGGITSITNPKVTVASIDYPDNNYTVRSVHSYDMSAGLPYTATMRDTVPNWLIYDESNAAASFNTHNVLYIPNVQWSGEHEADSKTKTKIIQRVNRRTMW